MNHQIIEDEHVVQRYLMGKLSEEDSARFEAHYLDCETCLASLAQAESLHRGLRHLAREAQPVAPASRRGARRLLPWVVAAAVLILTVGVGYHQRTVGRLEGANRDLRATATTIQGRLAQQDEAVAALRAQVGAQQAAAEEARAAQAAAAAHQGTAASELVTLGQRLAASLRDNERLTARLQALRRPRGNPLIALLSPVRSEDPAGMPRITPPSTPTTLVLSLALSPPLAPDHRAELRAEDGTVLWQGGDLWVDDRDTLSIALPSDFLAPGTYRVAVEAHTAAGWRPLDTFSFELVAP